MIVYNISFAIIDFNSQSCYFGNLALNLFYWLVKEVIGVLGKIARGQKVQMEPHP